MTRGTAALGSVRTDAPYIFDNAVTINGTFTQTGAQVVTGNETVNGNVIIGTVGSGLQVKEGTNGRMGLATLSGGTVTVANTSVTANTRIFLTVQTAGGTQGFLRVATVTAGTSFVITSTSGTETSTVAWLLVEPAP